MVEFHDETWGIYLSYGAEVRRLTDDGDARGWSGVLPIAGELIRVSNDLH
ncbi:hypothetical protein [Psychromicrobium sp. YIM B11713]